MTDTTGPRPPIRTAVEAPPWLRDEQPGDVAEPAPERLLAGTRRTDPARVVRHRPAADVASWAASEERIPVFVVEDEHGAQTVYSMPAKPHPGILFGFMADARVQGDVAFIGLVETCIGPDAVEAIRAEVGAMDGDEAAAFMRDVSTRMQRNLAGGLKGA